MTDVVRVCEATYSPKRLEQAGIKCHDWAFDDGMISDSFFQYIQIIHLNYIRNSTSAKNY